jgi:cell division septal protein FtsQ
MRLRLKLVCVTLGLLGVYGLWIEVLRDAPLFQVQTVTVAGLSGDAAPQISSTLELTAREMTTTDFSVARLRASVSSYAFVGGLRVRTEFPHGVAIEVIERRPLARLDVAGSIFAVSSDDRVLGGLLPSRELPLVRSSVLPIDGRVTDPLARQEIALLADAPAPLRSRVYAMYLGSDGLTAQLRLGPLLYFGSDALGHAKWDSAAAVLANPSSRGARYIDVSLPSRPAAQIDDPATSANASLTTAVASLSGASSTGPSTSTSG